MGLPVYVYRSNISDTNNGISNVQQLTLINVEGPFEPSDVAPAAMLVEGNLPNTVKIVLATSSPKGKIGPMFGGLYAATGDGRFANAIRRMTGTYGYFAVPIHDRFE